jgi:hypothetical protein
MKETFIGIIAAFVFLIAGVLCLLKPVKVRDINLSNQRKGIADIKRWTGKDFSHWFGLDNAYWYSVVWPIRLLGIFFLGASLLVFYAVLKRCGVLD